MGLFNKIEDSAVKVITKSETVRLSYEEISKIVIKEFVFGSDDEYLKKIVKTAKGAFPPFGFKELDSKNQRYKLHVGGRPNGLLLLPAKTVWVFDNQENKYYQTKSRLHWKKFYKCIVAAVSAEKTKRV